MGPNHVAYWASRKLNQWESPQSKVTWDSWHRSIFMGFVSIASGHQHQPSSKSILRLRAPESHSHHQKMAILQPMTRSRPNLLYHAAGPYTWPLFGGASWGQFLRHLDAVLPSATSVELAVGDVKIVRNGRLYHIVCHFAALFCYAQSF